MTSLGDKTNEGSRSVYITEKVAHHHVQNATFGLFAATSLFRLTGWFHIHLFYSTKIIANHHILLFSEKKMVSMSQEELMRYMADETDKTNKEGQDMNRILTS